jgi:hypothetical protein
MKPRPSGTVGVVEKPSGGLWQEAQRILAAKEAKLKADRERKAAIPVPNWRCYPTAFRVGMDVDERGNWLPDANRTPRKCRVCESVLHKDENHVCDGFVPKYVQHDDEWHERQEAKREAIRESRQLVRGRRCSACNNLLEDADDEQWHIEYCDHVPEQDEKRSPTGEDDDLSGYEDEPEYDYCEGDDDGYDCD